MHRSGTSLVANLFYEFGAPMGDPSTFYAADKWNPRGYFEQKEILSINMSLINGPWGRAAYFWLPSENTVRRRARELEERIRIVSDKYSSMVVKENRFCLTLGAWLEHGAKVDGIIVCLRDPMSIARSLKKRNRIPLWMGFRLWRQHITRLLDNTRGIRLHFIEYNRLLSADTFKAEIGGALRFAGINADDATIERIGAKCVDTSLNHGSKARAAYPPEVESLWMELLGKHKANA